MGIEGDKVTGVHSSWDNNPETARPNRHNATVGYVGCELDDPMKAAI